MAKNKLRGYAIFYDTLQVIPMRVESLDSLLLLLPRIHTTVLALPAAAEHGACRLMREVLSQSFG